MNALPTPSAFVSAKRGLRGLFYGWWIVIIAFVCHALSGGFYSTGMAVYFLPVGRDLGLSRAALSLAFTLRTLESGIDGPLLGMLVDKLGPRSMVRIGGLVAGLGFVLLAFTRDFVSFVVVFVGVLALGMSAGVHHPFMAIINQWFVRRRATAITLGLVGSELGGAVITPLIALVVYNLSWRHAAVLSGILFPLVLIPLTFFLRNTPESMGLQRDGDPPRKPLSAATASAATIGPPPAAVREDFTVREALHTAAFWHLAVAMGLRMFSKLALQVHMVPLMVWKGIDEPTAALLVGLSALAQLPFRIAGGWLGDRWSLNRVASVACLAGIAAALSLIFGPEGSVWTGAAFVLLFAVAESGNLSGWSLLGHFFGRARFATLRGTLSMVYSPIALPSPTFAGWVFDRTRSYTYALVPFACFYAGSCLLYWFIRRPKTLSVSPGIVEQV